MDFTKKITFKCGKQSLLSDARFRDCRINAFNLLLFTFYDNVKEQILTFR